MIKLADLETPEAMSARLQREAECLQRQRDAINGLLRAARGWRMRTGAPELPDALATLAGAIAAYDLAIMRRQIRIASIAGIGGRRRSDVATAQPA